MTQMKLPIETNIENNCKVSRVKFCFKGESVSGIVLTESNTNYYLIVNEDVMVFPKHLVTNLKIV